MHELYLRFKVLISRSPSNSDWLVAFLASIAMQNLDIIEAYSLSQLLAECVSDDVVSAKIAALKKHIPSPTTSPNKPKSVYIIDKLRLGVTVDAELGVALHTRRI